MKSVHTWFKLLFTWQIYILFLLLVHSTIIMDKMLTSEHRKSTEKKRRKIFHLIKKKQSTGKLRLFWLLNIFLHTFVIKFMYLALEIITQKISTLLFFFVKSVQIDFHECDSYFYLNIPIEFGSFWMNLSE